MPESSVISDPSVAADAGVGFAPRPSRDLPTAEEEARSCTACALHESRTNVVFGDGNPDADLLLVASSPSRTDDLLAEAYSGGPGNVVDNYLLDGGLSREDAYLCYLVNCRPPADRAPKTDEIGACSPYLRDQFANVQPRVILALGELPTQVLLRKAVPIAKVAGYRFPFLGATLIPTHDPVVALNGNQGMLTALKRDMRLAAAVLRGEVAGADAAMAELQSRPANGATAS